MKIRNRVQVIGNLGADPIIKEFKNGKKMARFTVASDELNLIKRAGEEKKQFVKVTTWFNVTAWGKNAEIAQERLCKGDEVIINGSLVTTSFTDRSGNIRKISEVMAESILYRNYRFEIERHNNEQSNQRA
ncbi:MAG: single-stranded DNA-binding protein [Bacteroidales bacterium]|jgi:single-strand DNA-binding protein|nr:single-stranded DNA-binding protein [Bacteroidales bacterium]HOL97573.1 single-stranded DNA-binding protein [Bacteroidales bacterium]HOM36714.1 single-stranded DNA-binding protein [Bacteroidales bacterium]HPD23264.1 single-stranded DNA-binding protein [Bacteroidales bacterium]HRS98988.1 single-stranded DNA-binding protein [Bacteroidales bacterium]